LFSPKTPRQLADSTTSEHKEMDSMDKFVEAIVTVRISIEFLSSYVSGLVSHVSHYHK
jgi:hypothetical protein